jgi:hypothetical protein
MVIGTTETEVEIAEYGIEDVFPAFIVDRNSEIVAIDGKLWKKSNISLLDFSSSKSVSPMIGNWHEAIAGVDADFLTTLCGFHRDMALPKVPTDLFDGLASSAGVISYLKKAGPIEKRKLAQLNEEGVESWRNLMRRYLGCFTIAGGTTFERVHEPALVIEKGRISLKNMGAYGQYLNRDYNDHLGIPVPKACSLDWNAHVFPAGAGDLAVSFAESQWGDANAAWFEIDCFGQESTLEDVLTSEARRFAALHILLFREHLDVGLSKGLASAAEREFTNDGSPYSLHAGAISDLEKAIVGSGQGTVGLEELSSSIGYVMQTGASLMEDSNLIKSERLWTNLRASTKDLMSRVDAMPISLAVSRNHALRI